MSYLVQVVGYSAWAEPIHIHNITSNENEPDTTPALYIGLEVHKEKTSAAGTLITPSLAQKISCLPHCSLDFFCGFELHDEAAKRDASLRIGLIVNKYGTGVVRLRYQQETGEIRSMLGDFKDAAASSALSELGLGCWVDELKQANQAFDSAYVQRSQEMVGYSSQVIALRAAIHCLPSHLILLCLF